MKKPLFIPKIAPLFVVLQFYTLFTYAENTVKDTSINPIQTQNTTEVTPTYKASKNTLRSRFAIGGDVGVGIERIQILMKNSAGRFETPPPSWMVSTTLGGAYYVSDGCQYQDKYTCADLLVRAGIGYQYLNVFAVSSFQIGLGAELDVFFGAQRKIGLILQVGIGYGYFSDINEGTLPSSPTLSFSFNGTNQSTGTFAHRWLIPIGVGALFHLPYPGLSLYALLQHHTSTTIDFGLAHFAFFPTIGIRYRF